MGSCISTPRKHLQPVHRRRPAHQPRPAEFELKPVEAQSRPVHVAPQKPREFRPVQSVQALGYQIVTQGEDGPDPTATDEERWSRRALFNYYRIYHPEQSEGIIAMLAASWEKPGVLVVSHIYTSPDPRRVGVRPLAADILLGFWAIFLGRRIEDLARIYFETVQEDTVTNIRGLAYESTYGGPLSHTFDITRRGGRGMEAEMFNRIYNHTKFGKCARTMVTQYQGMVDVGMFVSQFTFRPHPEGDQAPPFDFSITFDVDPVLMAQVLVRREKQRQQQIDEQRRQHVEELLQQEAEWQQKQAERDHQEEPQQQYPVEWYHQEELQQQYQPEWDRQEEPQRQRGHQRRPSHRRHGGSSSRRRRSDR